MAEKLLNISYYGNSFTNCFQPGFVLSLSTLTCRLFLRILFSLFDANNRENNLSAKPRNDQIGKFERIV